jgi:hypothetical protein
MCVVYFMPQPPYTQERTRYPLKRRLGRPQSQCGRFEEEKNLLASPGFIPRFMQFVAYSLYCNDNKLKLEPCVTQLNIMEDRMHNVYSIPNHLVPCAFRSWIFSFFMHRYPGGMIAVIFPDLLLQKWLQEKFLKIAHFAQFVL